MNNIADEYLKNDINHILEQGTLDENPRPKYSDGQPAHTLSVNQVVRTYDLSNDNFPISTLRPIAWKSAIKEMLWIFVDQTSDLNVLQQKYNIKVWNDWESKDVPNTIGQRYGATIKKYDLMNKLINGLKNDPFGRRHIIDLFQYSDFEQTDGLIPCAFCSMWSVRQVDDVRYLDMTLVQRSGDMLTASGAGGWNEVQYMALMYMVAQCCGYRIGKFVHFVQNEQIYDRHLEQANILLSRSSINCNPKLKINKDKKNYLDFTIEDFELIDYPVDKIKENNPQLKFDLGI